MDLRGFEPEGREPGERERLEIQRRERMVGGPGHQELEMGGHGFTKAQGVLL